MTGDEILTVVRRAGVNGAARVDVGDYDYVLPAEEGVGGYRRAWVEKMLELGMTYEEDAEDCDDFARVAAAFALLWHAGTSGRPRKKALAFGVVWYVRDAGGGHAVNCYVTVEADMPVLRFLEPQQPLMPFDLSENELANIERIEF